MIKYLPLGFYSRPVPRALRWFSEERSASPSETGRATLGAAAGAAASAGFATGAGAAAATAGAPGTVGAAGAASSLDAGPLYAYDGACTPYTFATGEE